jgi:hypothetical protein
LNDAAAACQRIISGEQQLTDSFPTPQATNLLLAPWQLIWQQLHQQT